MRVSFLIYPDVALRLVEQLPVLVGKPPNNCDKLYCTIKFYEIN